MKALEKLRDRIFRDYPPERKPGVFAAEESRAFVQDWTAYTPLPTTQPRGYYRTCGPAGEVEWVSEGVTISAMAGSGGSGCATEITASKNMGNFCMRCNTMNELGSSKCRERGHVFYRVTRSAPRA